MSAVVCTSFVAKFYVSIFFFSDKSVANYTCYEFLGLMLKFGIQLGRFRIWDCDFGVEMGR